ncbi:MAG TPA: hypothetical protein VF668_12625 [Pyrinomonadaceae bacterium]|jgi:hypothetical protein
MEATTTHTYDAPADLGRYRGRALLAGLVFLAVGAALAFVMGQASHYGGLVHVLRSYLVGFFLVTGVSVGSLAWLCLGHMTGGAWAVTSRRLFEAATRCIPLCFVLFIPVAISLFVHEGGGEGGHALSVYEWSDPHAVAGDPALQHKAVYLNWPFFLARALVYFAIWFGMAVLLSRWSARQDNTADPRIRRRLQDVSGPGILLFGLTVTFAAIDWGMSLEPHWFSTIYGLIIMAGWGLSALAFVITVAVYLSQREPMAHAYQPLHFHDWGKLLLALVMLYAYFSFSQFLIIWAGNLPEEIPFYLRRLRGGWQYVGLAIILFHFALPFVLLLSRGRKRAPRSLRRIALLMIFMRVVDLIFFFAPSVHQGGESEWGARDVLASFLPMFAMALGLGGVWLWYYFGQLASRPLLPLGDRDLEKSIAPAEGHH